jgi:hypothetical protein
MRPTVEAIAEELQVIKGGVAGLVQIHAATGNQIQRVLGGDLAFVGYLVKVLEDWVAWGFVVELGFPGVEGPFAFFAGGRFVDEVVGGAAEPIDGVGAAAEFLREEAAGEVEALRAELGGLAGLGF